MKQLGGLQRTSGSSKQEIKFFLLMEIETRFFGRPTRHAVSKNTHTYTHTHTHVYIHTYTHTYTLTYIHTHTYTRTYIRTYIRTHIHTYIPTYMNTHIHTYVHKYIIHTYMHTKHTYIHTYIYKYIHTQIYINIHKISTGHTFFHYTNCSYPRHFQFPPRACWPPQNYRQTKHCQYTIAITVCAQYIAVCWKRCSTFAGTDMVITIPVAK
jgi:hypothetical protein